MTSPGRLFSVTDIKDLTGLNVRTVQRRLRSVAPAHLEQVNTGQPRRLYALDALPMSIRAAIVGTVSLTDAAADFKGLSSQRDIWERAPQHKRKEANRRLTAVNAYLHYHEELRLSCEASRARVQTELGVPPDTLRKWVAKVKGAPHAEWLTELLPRHCNPNPQRRDVHPQILVYFESLYRSESQPSIARCIRDTQRLARKNPEWGQFPSDSYFARLVKDLWKEDPIGMTRSRKGHRAAERLRPAQRRDKSMFSAYEYLSADGHEPDVFIEWPSRVPGEKPFVGRGALMVVQDIYSGYPLAWHLDRTENTQSATVMLSNAIREFGVFDAIQFDNGHAFASKSMTGGAPNRFRFKRLAGDLNGWLTNLDVNIRFVTPEHGQAKPVERLNRQLAEAWRGVEFHGAYTGNSVENKPANYGERAIPYAEMVKHIDRIMQEIRDAHSNAGQCGGRTRSDTFFQSFEQRKANGEIRKLTDAQLRWLTLSIEEVTVRQDSTVHLQNNRYRHNELYALRGHKVHLRYDPDDLHAGVWLFEHGKLQPICFAECFADSGFADLEAARRAGRIKREERNLEKKKLKERNLKDKKELRDELATAQPAASKPKRDRNKVVHGNFSPALRLSHKLPEGVTETAVRDMQALLLRSSGGSR